MEITFNKPVRIEGIHIVPADASPPGLPVEGVIGVTTPKLFERPFDVRLQLHDLQHHRDVRVVADIPGVKGGVMWFPLSPTDAMVPTNMLFVEGTFTRMTLIVHGTVLELADIPADALGNFQKGRLESAVRNGAPGRLDGSDWETIEVPRADQQDPSSRDWAKARAVRRVPSSLGLSLMPPPFLPACEPRRKADRGAAQSTDAEASGPASARGTIMTHVRACLEEPGLGLSVPTHELGRRLREEAFIPERHSFSAVSTGLTPTVLVPKGAAMELRQIVDRLADPEVELEATLPIDEQTHVMLKIFEASASCVIDVMVGMDEAERWAEAEVDMTVGDMFDDSDDDDDDDNDDDDEKEEKEEDGNASGGDKKQSGVMVNGEEMVTFEEVITAAVRDRLCGFLLRSLTMMLRGHGLSVAATTSVDSWLAACNATLEGLRSCMAAAVIAEDFAAMGGLTILVSILHQEDLPPSIKRAAADALATAVCAHPTVVEMFVLIPEVAEGDEAQPSAYQSCVQALSGLLADDPLVRPLRKVLSCCALLDAGCDMEVGLLQLTTNLAAVNENLSRRLTTQSSGFSRARPNSDASGSLGNTEKSEAEQRELLSSCAVGLDAMVRRANKLTKWFIRAEEVACEGINSVSVARLLMLRRVSFLRSCLVVSSIASSTREAAAVCEGLDGTLAEAESLVSRLTTCILRPGGETLLCMGGREMQMASALLDSYTGGQSNDVQALPNIWRLQLPVINAPLSSSSSRMHDDPDSSPTVRGGLIFRTVPDTGPSLGWHLWLASQMRSLVDSVVRVPALEDGTEAGGFASRLELLSAMCEFDATRSVVAQAVLRGTETFSDLLSILENASSYHGSCSHIRASASVLVTVALSDAQAGRLTEYAKADNDGDDVLQFRPDIAAALSRLIDARMSMGFHTTQQLSVCMTAAERSARDARSLVGVDDDDDDIRRHVFEDEELMWIYADSLTGMLSSLRLPTTATRLVAALETCSRVLAAPPRDITGEAVILPTIVSAHCALRLLREMPAVLLLEPTGGERDASIAEHVTTLALHLVEWLQTGTRGPGFDAPLHAATPAASSGEREESSRTGRDPSSSHRYTLQFVVGALEACVAVLARWAKSPSVQLTALALPPRCPEGVPVCVAVLRVNAALRALQLGTDECSTRTGGGAAYLPGVSSACECVRRSTAVVLKAECTRLAAAAPSAAGACVTGILAETALAIPSMLESNLELACEHFTLMPWDETAGEAIRELDEVAAAVGTGGPLLAQSFHQALGKMHKRSSAYKDKSADGILQQWGQCAWHALMVGCQLSSSARVHHVLPVLLGRTIAVEIEAAPMNSSSATSHASHMAKALVCTLEVMVDDFLAVSAPAVAAAGTIPLGLVRLLNALNQLCGSRAVLLSLWEAGVGPPLLKALRLCPTACPEACVALMQVLETVFTEMNGALSVLYSRRKAAEEIAEKDKSKMDENDVGDAGGEGDKDATDARTVVFDEGDAQADEALKSAVAYLSTSLVPILLITFRCFVAKNGSDDGNDTQEVPQQVPTAAAGEVVAQCFLLAGALPPLDRTRLVLALHGLHRRRVRVCTPSGSDGSSSPSGGGAAGLDDVPGLPQLIDSVMPLDYDSNHPEADKLDPKLQLLAEGLDWSVVVHVMWREMERGYASLDSSKETYKKLVDQYAAYHSARANEALTSLQATSKGRSDDTAASDLEEALLPPTEAPLDWSPRTSLAAAHNALSCAVMAFRAAADMLTSCLSIHDRAMSERNISPSDPATLRYKGYGQGNPWLGRQATVDLLGALLRLTPLPPLGRPVQGGNLLTTKLSARDELKRNQRMYVMWTSELTQSPLLRLEYHTSEGHAGAAGDSSGHAQVFQRLAPGITGSQPVVPADPSVLLSPFSDSNMVATLPGTHKGSAGAIAKPQFSPSGVTFFPTVSFEIRHVLILSNMKWLADHLRIIRDMCSYRNLHADTSGSPPAVFAGESSGPPSVPSFAAGHTLRHVSRQSDGTFTSATMATVATAAHMKAVGGAESSVKVHAQHLASRDNFVHAMLFHKVLGVRGLNSAVLFTDAYPARLVLRSPLPTSTS